MTISARLRALGFNDHAMRPNPDPDCCQWYLLCGNQPAGTVRHPRLGEVLCCERHAHELGFQLTRPEITDDTRWEPTDKARKVRGS